MEDIREQMVLGEEISNAISNPVGMGQELDEDELQKELEELEEETLDAQLEGARPVPIHSPGASTRIGALPCQSARARCGYALLTSLYLLAAPTKTREEEDEDAELRELQAALAS